MKAVVMAGGEGSRLRPLILGRPKPMVPIVNRPVMEHILLLLKRHGITEVVVTVQYLARVIQEYFGDGAALGMRLHYSVEEVPLGTAGSVKQAEPVLDETFLVISGDALTDLDLTAIVDYHRARKAVATLTLTRMSNPLEYGVVITDQTGRIQRFQEKPSWSEVISDTINTGIYVLEPEVLRQCPAGRPFDFSQDLFPALLAAGRPLYGYMAGGYWTDVGTLGEYARACFDVLTGAVQAETGPSGQQRGERAGVWCEEDTTVDPRARLSGPIYIGPGCQIGPEVVIEGPAVIGAHTRVEQHARMARSILWPRCTVGVQADLRGAIVGERCVLDAHCALREGAVVADGCRVGAGALVQANVKIWPDKEIEAGATVASSLVWGERSPRRLFQGATVAGLANREVTPAFAARLGAAYGTTLPPGSTVALNRDPYRTTRMIKRALIAGLPSAGIDVADCASIPLPVFRYYIRASEEIGGGLHVRLSPQDGRVVEVRVLDTSGQDIAPDVQRLIETHVFRADVRRAQPDAMGAIAYAEDPLARYRRDFLAHLDARPMQTARFRLVVDYGHGPTARVLPGLLDALGCEWLALNETVPDNVPGVPGESPDDLGARLRRVGALTAALELDLGVVIDSDGERLLLTDDQGRRVPPMTAVAALAALACQAHEGAVVAAPLAAPRVLEQLAAQHGATIVRLPGDLRGRVALHRRVTLAGDGAGRVIVPAFQPVPDALIGLATLLELLAVTGSTLRQTVGALPTYFQGTADVPCAWDQAGTVLRTLTESHGPERSKAAEATGEGIRIDIDEAKSVVIAPDKERPLVHVVAEAPTQQAASKLAQAYAGIVRDLQHA